MFNYALKLIKNLCIKLIALKKHELWERISSIAHIALAVFIIDASVFSAHIVDTIMLSRLGESYLSAFSFGCSTWQIVMLFLFAVTRTLMPFVAYELGVGNTRSIISYLQQMLWICCLLAVVTVAFLKSSRYWLRWFDMSDEYIAIIAAYYDYLLLGVIPLFLLLVLDSFNQAHAYFLPTLVVSFLGPIVNITLSWILIYGNLGFPKLMSSGAGLSSSLSLWLEFLTLLLLSWKNYKYLLQDFKWQKPKLVFIKKLLLLALPNGLLEIVGELMFLVIAVFILPYSNGAFTAHNISVQVVNIFSLLPIAISTAICLQISTDLGKNRRIVKSLKKIGIYTNLVLSIFVSCILVFSFLDIIRLYSNDVAVIYHSQLVLFYLAFFFIIHSIYRTLRDILLSYQETWYTALTTIVFNIVIITITYYFNFSSKYLPLMGIACYWIALSMVYILVSVFLTQRIKVLSYDTERIKSITC